MIVLTTWWRTCLCGCLRHNHSHLRAGSDCTCGCPRFHRIDWAAFLPPHPAATPLPAKEPPMTPLLSQLALWVGLPLFTYACHRCASRIPAPSDIEGEQ